MVPGSSPGGRINKKTGLPVFLFMRRSEARQVLSRKAKSAVERRWMRSTGAFIADPGRAKPPDSPAVERDCAGQKKRPLCLFIYI